MRIEHCDVYRDFYPSMSRREKVDWHSRLWREHEDQSHFNGDAVAEFFDGIGHPLSVVEVGGWRGECAEFIISEFPDKIWFWRNHELCVEARGASVCSHGQYKALAPPARYSGADVAVFSHVLEHMSEVEIVATVTEAMKHVNFIYVDGPEACRAQGSTSFHVVDDWLVIARPLLDQWGLAGSSGNAKWYAR